MRWIPYFIYHKFFSWDVLLMYGTILKVLETRASHICG